LLDDTTERKLGWRDSLTNEKKRRLLELEEMVRPRIAYTVDEKTKQNLDRIIQIERQSAQARDMPSPSASQIAEMIIRKGIKTYQKEKQEK